MSATDSGWLDDFAGVWPADNGLAGRIGERLTALPGRWRWAVERFLGWWFAELAALFRPASGVRRPSVLTIDEAHVLAFTFALPAEALGLVRERAALMIEERTPFAIGEVVAAYRLESGQPLSVHVRLTPLDHLKAISPGRDWEALVLDGGDEAAMCVMLPSALLAPEKRRARAAAVRSRLGLALAVPLALAIVLVAPLLTLQRALAVERAALEEDRLVMAPLMRRAVEARAYKQAAGGALRLKTTAASPLAVLDHVTGRIPEDSYLTSFRLADGDGVIAGLTTQASALPQPLEADLLLANVRLLGPVSRDELDGRMRFEIGFKVVR